MHPCHAWPAVCFLDGVSLYVTTALPQCVYAGTIFDFFLGVEPSTVPNPVIYVYSVSVCTVTAYHILGLTGLLRVLLFTEPHYEPNTPSLLGTMLSWCIDSIDDLWAVDTEEQILW